MAKYSENEIEQMAKAVVMAESLRDMRVIELYTRVSQLTGMPPDHVRRRIFALAGEIA